MAIESSAKAVAKLTDADGRGLRKRLGLGPRVGSGCAAATWPGKPCKGQDGDVPPSGWDVLHILPIYVCIYIHELFIDVDMDVCGINCTCLNMMIDNEREHLRFETMGWHRLYVISLSYSTCWGILMRRLKPWAELGSNKLWDTPPLIHAELWLLVSLFHYVDLDGYGWLGQPKR